MGGGGEILPVGTSFNSDSTVSSKLPTLLFLWKCRRWNNSISILVDPGTPLPVLRKDLSSQIRERQFLQEQLIAPRELKSASLDARCHEFLVVLDGDLEIERLLGEVGLRELAALDA